MSWLRQAQRVDSAARWEEINPVLENGELGVARFYDDEGKVVQEKMKCGDGIKGADGIVRGTPWNELPWLTGGEKGEKGDTGPAPKHDWQGTALRFQNPDGSWGDRVDLKGEPGNRVNAEPATITTLGGVMPATGLRVDVEGHEYVALEWNKHVCYPDPIVVIHDGSAWLWLRPSGVGMEDGVREPGTEAAAEHWRQVANIRDMPLPGTGLEWNRDKTAFDVKYGHESYTALEGNATAVAAKKLETARAMSVALGSAQPASFDGTKNVNLGVTGVLGPANGGTGVNNLAALKSAMGAGPRLLYASGSELRFKGSQLYLKFTGLVPGTLLYAASWGAWSPDDSFRHIFTSSGDPRLSGLAFGYTDHDSRYYDYYKQEFDKKVSDPNYKLPIGVKMVWNGTAVIATASRYGEMGTGLSFSPQYIDYMCVVLDSTVRLVVTTSGNDQNVRLYAL